MDNIVSCFTKHLGPDDCATHNQEFREFSRMLANVLTQKMSAPYFNAFFKQIADQAQAIFKQLFLLATTQPSELVAAQDSTQQQATSKAETEPNNETWLQKNAKEDTGTSEQIQSGLTSLEMLLGHITNEPQQQDLAEQARSETLPGNPFHQKLIDMAANDSVVSYFGSGSFMEGTALARLFYPYSSEQGKSADSLELEIDIMMEGAEFSSEAKEAFVYAPTNAAFLQIKISQDCYQTLCKKFGKKDADMVVVRKKGQMYLNALALKHKDYYAEKLPVLFGISNQNQGNEATAAELEPLVKIEDDGSPSLAATITYNFSFGYEDCERIIQDTKNTVAATGFAEKASSQMADLIQITNKFQNIYEANTPIKDQIETAAEWAVICLEMSELIFNMHKVSACSVINKVIGLDWTAEENKNRRKMDYLYENYLKVLLCDDDEQVLQSEEGKKRITRVLNDIATERSSGSIMAFQTFIELQLMFNSTLNFQDPTPPVDELRTIGRKAEAFSIDLVPSFKCSFWPSVAAEWVTRKREWPEKAVIDAIVAGGVHLVAKMYEGGDQDFDWRLSFSIAELRLCEVRSADQQFVYFIFKCIYYRFVKPLKDKEFKSLPSYLAKTIMLRKCELDPLNKWREENYPDCLKELLQLLLEALQTGTLKHYFLPSVNLLAGIDANLRQEAAKVIEQVLTDPVGTANKLEASFPKMINTYKAFTAQREKVPRCYQL